MAENTAIEWCDATFNPWWGCQKVSPACDHCYAERDAKRFAPGRVLWGVDSERRTFPDKPDGKNGHWAAPTKWAKTLPAKLGRRPRVFCASMADWLDLDAPLDQFVRLLDTIRCTPELDWLLLSKRIGNWRKRMSEARDALVARDGEFGALAAWADDWLNDAEQPSNAWIGATMANQEEFDRDIAKLDAVPARAHFLSLEPMLGPITMPWEWLWGTGSHNGIDWVICGGESGHGARPFPIKWARSLMQQCKAAGVAFHMKQLGSQPRGWCVSALHMEPADRADLEEDFCDLYEAHECGRSCDRCAMLVHRKGGDMAEWPEDLRVREFPCP